MIARARRISPRDPRCHRWLHYAGWCHWRQGDFEMEGWRGRRSNFIAITPAQWIN